MIWFWGVWDRFKTGLFESPNTGPWVRYGYALMHFIGLELWNLPSVNLFIPSRLRDRPSLIASLLARSVHKEHTSISWRSRFWLKRSLAPLLIQGPQGIITLPTGHTGRGGSYYKVTSKVLVFCYGIRRKKRRRSWYCMFPWKIYIASSFYSLRSIQ